MKVIFVFFLILVLSLTVTNTIQASAYSFIGVTDNGVEFPIEYHSSNIGNNTGTGDGNSMIDGMGVVSRMIQKEYDGRLTHGTGIIGTDVSLVPYLPVDISTEFVALIQDTDKELLYHIPTLGSEYELRGDTLYNIKSQNILDYTNNITVFGDNTISTNNKHITVTGDGVSIIKIDDSLNSETLYFDGNVESGFLKIVTSDYDLLEKGKYLYEFSDLQYTEYGYNVGEVKCVMSRTPETVTETKWTYETRNWYHHRNQVVYYHDHTYSCQIKNLEGINNVNISSRSNIYNSLETQVTQSTSYVTCEDRSDGCTVHSSKNGKMIKPIISTINNDIPSIYSIKLIINLDEDIIIEEIEYKTISTYCYYCRSFTNYYQTHDVEILPVLYDKGIVTNTINSFDGIINNEITLQSGTSYLMIKPEGNTISIRITEVKDVDSSLQITNLPENTPYQITKSNEVIATGITSSGGIIDLDKMDVNNEDNTVGGYLHLYPDSLSYRGDFSTVILDGINKESIHLESNDDKVYVVHAYADIPVVGNVTISNLSIVGKGGIEYLSYLDGNYINGNKIKVPVIPTFSTIHMKINGVPTTLNYSDILGSIGIKIAETNQSTIRKSDPNNRLSSIESTVGTSTYVIATIDGTVNAIVTETISGSASITNTYYLQKIPPPPPQPVRRDPLSGWVDVHVNGEFVKQVSLGINPYPDFTPSGTVTSNRAIQSVTYSYPDYVVSGAVSIDVNAGDFVEFYLYGKIHGDIGGYSAPSGYNLVGEKGSGTATVIIRSATIQTSM